MQIEQLKRVVKVLAKKAAVTVSKRRKAQELIPEVVDALVENGRIFEHQKTAAASKLLDHTSCLKMLLNLSKHRNVKEAFSPEKPYRSGKSILIDAPICDYLQTDAGQRFKTNLLGY